jgi:hypothetical protein
MFWLAKTGHLRTAKIGIKRLNSLKQFLGIAHALLLARKDIWPAPGSEDIESRCLMEQEAGQSAPGYFDVFANSLTRSTSCRTMSPAPASLASHRT